MTPDDVNSDGSNGNIDSLAAAEDIREAFRRRTLARRAGMTGATRRGRARRRAGPPDRGAEGPTIPVDRVFGSNADLPALAGVSGAHSSGYRFLRDVVEACSKVMPPDRSDLDWPGVKPP